MNPLHPNINAFLASLDAIPLTDKQAQEQKRSDLARAAVLDRERAIAAAGRVVQKMEAGQRDLASAMAQRSQKRQEQRRKRRDYQREWWRRRRRRPYVLKRGPAPRPVETDDGQRYASVPHAAFKLKLCERSIYTALLQPTSLAGGRRWKYADAPRPQEWDQPRRSGPSNQRAVVTSRGERFATVKAAEQALGASTRYLREALLNGWRVKGRHVCYADQPEAVEFLQVPVDSAAAA